MEQSRESNQSGRLVSGIVIGLVGALSLGTIIALVLWTIFGS